MKKMLKFTFLDGSECYLTYHEYIPADFITVECVDVKNKAELFTEECVNTLESYVDADKILSVIVFKILSGIELAYNEKDYCVKLLWQKCDRTFVHILVNGGFTDGAMEVAKDDILFELNERMEKK